MKSIVARTFALAAAITLGVAQPPSAAAATSGDAVVPYKIQVPDAVLADLKARLARTRFPDEIPGTSWDYGANLGYMKELVGYWRDKYDWRAQEKRLNQFDQFTTNIDGLNIHFVHQRSKVPNARALLLLNGWPGSIEEFAQVIGPLTDPVAHGGRAEDAFNVIVPDMPGYAFSDKPKERGYSPERIAGMWATLMARLGYTKYAVQGTDWGASVATWLALKDAAHMTALHLSTCLGAPVAAPAPRTGTQPAPTMGAEALGYVEIQSTKAETLAYGLSDSPAGLAGWIVEKYHGWSDDGGNVESVYTKDQLLTNIMIYWVTDSGPSSTRLYYEARHRDGRLLGTFFEGFGPPMSLGKVTVPTGCGNFTGRFDRGAARGAAPQRASAEARYNVVYWTVSEHGGHFPAMEQPKLWLDDIRGFLRASR
jgi:pimeloyl-ACP methyl ester carboxylesterase